MIPTPVAPEPSSPSRERASRLVEDLLDALVRDGEAAAAAVARARDVAALENQRADVVLTRLGLVSEEAVCRRWAALLSLPVLEDRALEEAVADLDGLDPGYLEARGALPIADPAGGLRLVLADPLDRAAVAAVAFARQRAVEPVLAAPSAVRAALERALRASEAPAGADPDSLALDLDRLRDLASDAPVVLWVNGLLEGALAAGASDVHLDPGEGVLAVRYRVDGVLREVDPPPGPVRAAVVPRLKIMARLDIAEQRRPQDGRAQMTLRGRRVDLRVATAPTPHGESMVIRVLDSRQGTLTLDRLGYAEDVERRIRDLARKPSGMLLVTGPTGSGKTTTLYALLGLLNSRGRKLITVEDPVEYSLAGVAQIQANAEIGLGFATVLRSVLRHNPDIVMVGEIRDVETARMAVEAALTGHPILSTLHTNSAAGAITRLREMGIAPYLLAAVISGVVAQRLVRRLCDACAERAPLDAGLAARLGAPEGAAIRRPVGCRGCQGSGFRGRVAVAEALVAGPAVRRLILDGAAEPAIAAAAAEAGMVPLARDAAAKALAGLVAVDDVLPLLADAAAGAAGPEREGA